VAELWKIDPLTEPSFQNIAIGEKVNKKNSLHVQSIAVVCSDKQA
jgi:hypothetical protein